MSRNETTLPSQRCRGPIVGKISRYRLSFREKSASCESSRCFLLSAGALPWAEPQVVAQTSISGAEQREGGEAYQLVWSDEFNEDGPPDPTKWNFEHGFVRNHELQWYQAENASCKDGLLVIEARRERVRNSNYILDVRDWRQNRPYADFTSACVTTRGLHRWTFARIEVRARIDARDGLWPAIWTVGDAGRWPASGEIDLMEYYQGHLLSQCLLVQRRPLATNLGLGEEALERAWRQRMGVQVPYLADGLE